MKKLLTLFASALMLTSQMSFAQTAESEKAVYNETTGVGYDDLKTAWNAVSGTATLIMNTDQTIDVRLNSGTNKITLKGANRNVRLTRTNKNNLLFLAQGNNDNSGEIHIENITLDGKGDSTDKCFTEASGSGKNYGIMTMTNVIIDNAISTHNQGLVTVKVNGFLTLNNVIFTNTCKVNDNFGYVFVGNEHLTISGNNEMTIAIQANGKNCVNVNGTLENTNPIVIYPYDAESFPENYAVVKGCSDPSKFNIQGNSNMTLKAENGNLVAAVDSETGVTDIISDNADAPVEYYNLQGVKVANPENGIFIRVQGKDVKKVVIK